MGRWITCLLLLLVGTGWNTLAGQTSFTASVDKNPVGLNDRFKLTLTIENASGNITPPNLNDFNLVFGPAKSTSYQIVNGQASNTISFTYTLVPKSTGEFVIGKAVARTDKGTLESQPITLKVVEGSSQAAQQQRSQTQGAAGGGRGNDELFAEIRLDKKKVYKGEQVIITYLVYSRYRNIDFTDYDFPALNGFYSHNFKEEQAGWKNQLEVINGKQYRVAVLRRQILFPQQHGTLRIDPMGISARVDYSFFNPGRAVSVKSNAVELEVLPLPPKQGNFKGDVGTFTMDVKPDRTELEANDAINLSVKISGRGNLKLVSAPEIKFPKDFEVYDPKTTDRFSTASNGLSGSREFEYLIIPRHSGKYNLEPIVFTFFDPQAGSYKTLKSDPIEINVARGTAEAPGTAYPGATREDVLILDQDIRYIKPVDTLRAQSGYFFGTTLFYTLMGMPLALALVVFLARRKYIRDRQDVVSVRSRKAGKMARKLLAVANKHLQANETGPFYDAVFKALYGYLGGKLNIDPGSLNRPQIQAGLDGKSVPAETTAALMELLSRCEMARFAPSSDYNPSQDYQEAARLIGELQKKL